MNIYSVGGPENNKTKSIFNFFAFSERLKIGFHYCFVGKASPDILAV
jgi:hypothetical protein